MEDSGSGRYVHRSHPIGIPREVIDGSDLMKDNTIDSMRRDISDFGNHTNKALDTGQELQVTSVIQGRSLDSDKVPRKRLRPHQPRLFSAKELSSSIIASESTRIICSVLIAILVVLSYIDYPLLGINIVNSKSIIAVRPLYLFLVTEITILIAHLVIVRRRRFEDYEEEDSRVLKEGGLNWERAVRVLERGLVAHQTVRAVFIDCSVYVVIVISESRGYHKATKWRILRAWRRRRPQSAFKRKSSSPWDSP